ncbi:MAG TPA: Rieske (2Fe-2S) protein [Pseudonocardia sp.]|nr:Rieske (2Fe-2S) protein [Pseudonocardia sp.]
MSTPDTPPLPRRAVIAAAAGLGAAAACGPAATPSTDATASVASSPPPTPTREPRPVAPADDIPVGGGRVYPDLRVVVTQPSPGEFRGFGIVCTHDSCELNAVKNGTINCPCHGSRYAITDGSVVRGPARTGLRTEKVAVQGDQVVLL